MIFTIKDRFVKGDLHTSRFTVITGDVKAVDLIEKIQNQTSAIPSEIIDNFQKLDSRHRHPTYFPEYEFNEKLMPPKFNFNDKYAMEFYANKWTKHILNLTNERYEYEEDRHESKFIFSVELSNGLDNDLIPPMLINRVFTRIYNLVCDVMMINKNRSIAIKMPEFQLTDSQTSRLMEFLIRFVETTSNTNVIIETYNEQIILSLLVACKKEQITAEDVAINHVVDETIISVPIIQKYRIKHAPDTFFNQLNIDQKFLVGF